MSMYEREPNFEDHFKVGDRFALMNLEYAGTITTRVGQAEKVLVTVITRESYPERRTYSALGVGFANLARRATSDDFPHIAEYIRVELPGGKTLKRFARVDVSPGEWKDGNDGPPIDMSQFESSNSGSAPVGGASPDPGF